MRIALLSCFYPFRGGISQFNSFLVKEFAKEHTVKAFNFKRQYPQFLFPGKTQYVENYDENAVLSQCETVLDTANPFSYFSTAKKIVDFKPDLLITRYWMSYFSPSLGSVNYLVSKALRKEAKRAGANFDFQTISITDNALPHERHFFDKPFSRYYFGSVDRFVAMSVGVERDILSIKPNAKVEIIKHPIYSNYGERIDKEKAQLQIFNDHLKGEKVLLFFGLIRDYKGLDILLNAMPLLGKGYKLIVAGEPYGGFEKYQQIIDSIEDEDIRKNIYLMTTFIPDEQVKVLFSASDLCILPYKSATQSGISSVSWNFDTPIVATPVGGLVEDIRDSKTGILSENVSSESVASAIQHFFSDGNIAEECINNIKTLKTELSWKSFCSKLINFANSK